MSSTTFRRVMTTCGVSAAVIGAGYLVASTIALNDGPGRIVIPTEVHLLVAVSICSTVVLGAGAWLIDAGNRITAERDVRPLIRAEVDAALVGIAPAIADAVLDRMSVGADERITRVADAAAARVAGRLQEVVTGEIMADVINAAVGRAHRAGMVLQAQSVAPKAVAPVVRMRNGDN